MPITESRSPARVFVTVANHDGCPQNGAYAHDGSAPRYPRAVVAASRPEYRSVCSGCGDTTWLPRVYPKVEYAPIPEAVDGASA